MKHTSSDGSLEFESEEFNEMLDKIADVVTGKELHLAGAVLTSSVIGLALYSLDDRSRVEKIEHFDLLLDQMREGFRAHVNRRLN